MPSTKAQIERLGRLQKIGAWALLGMVVLFYFIAYRPQSATLAKLNSAIASERAELGSNRSRTAGLALLEHQVKTLRERLDRYDRRLPRQEDFGPFIVELNALAAECGIKRMPWKRGDLRAKDQVIEVPINISCRTDYPSFASFMKKVEQMQRLTRIRSMSVHCADSKSGAVDVQMTMNIYFAEAR